MTVVDTSALVAILLGEHERAVFRTIVERPPARALLSGVSLLEAAMVLASRLGEAALADLDRYVSRNFEVVAFDAPAARGAREAFLKFGKGRHRAGLNFGDCAVYALAKARGRPLLFKGGDFGHTDIEPAWTPAGET